MNIWTIWSQQVYVTFLNLNRHDLFRLFIPIFFFEIFAQSEIWKGLKMEISFTIFLHFFFVGEYSFPKVYKVKVGLPNRDNLVWLMEKQTIYYRLFPGQERIDDGFDDIHRRAFLKNCIFLSKYTHSRKDLQQCSLLKGLLPINF